MNLNEMFRNSIASLDIASPKIKIVFGVVGLVAAGVTACVASYKAKKEFKPEMDDFTNIKKMRLASKSKELSEKVGVSEDISSHYTDKDYARDVVGTCVRFTGKALKLYAIPTAIAAGSIALIFNGANVLSNRLAAVTMTNAGLTKAYEALYSEYKKEVGEEKAEAFRYGTKDVQIEETKEVVDENGEKRTVTQTVTAKEAVGNPLLRSDFAFYFDEECSEYVNDITMLESIARAHESYFNTCIAKSRKNWVTLNEIYEKFGCPPKQYKKAGPRVMTYGVRYIPNPDVDEDTKVDLRIQRVYVRDEKGVRKPKILIDPNVTNIYDRILKDYEISPV